jgi:hypothetical protein
MALTKLIALPSFAQTFFEGVGGLGGPGAAFNAASLQCGFSNTAGRAFWAIAVTPETNAFQVIQGDFHFDALLNVGAPALDPGNPNAANFVTMQFHMVEEFPFLGWGPGFDRVPGQTVNGQPTNDAQFIETPIGDPFTITDTEYAALVTAGAVALFEGDFSRPLSDAFFGAGASWHFRGPGMNGGLIGITLWPTAWHSAIPGNSATVVANATTELHAEVIPELSGLDGLEYNRAQSRVDRCRKCGLPSLRQEWVRDGYTKLLVCPHCQDPVQRDENRQPVQPEDPLGINPTD